MSFQKKLYPCFDKDFWQDLNKSLSHIIKDLLLGRDISRVAKSLRDAGISKCSDSLLYKWSNPNDDTLPALRAFMLLIKICEDCSPVDSLGEACGKIACPDHDYREGIRHYDREFEKRERFRGPQAGTPAPLGPGI